jgi:hypothetical protein
VPQGKSQWGEGEGKAKPMAMDSSSDIFRDQTWCNGRSWARNSFPLKTGIFHSFAQYYKDFFKYSILSFKLDFILKDFKKELLLFMHFMTAFGFVLWQCFVFDIVIVLWCFQNAGNPEITCTEYWSWNDYLYLVP